ncbi:MAG: hypothetical protein ACD_62C00220G0001 [uncultured bacterium]|nr:MAG: hypothetical protein ACD_62C00220G0001 [uncultured bacterium]
MPKMIFPIIGLVAAMGVFVYTLVRAKINLKLTHLIKDTPTSKIGFIKNGFVEVCGTILAGGALLEAPISKKKCVYYEFELAERVRSGKSAHWKTRIKESKDVPFLLQDDTGKTLVNMNGAKTIFDEDSEFTSGGLFGEDTPESTKQLLKQKYGFNAEGWVFDKTLRFTETILEHGNQIYVLGNAQVSINDTVIKKDDIMIVADGSEENALSDVRGSLSGNIFFAIVSLGASVFIVVKYLL